MKVVSSSDRGTLPLRIWLLRRFKIHGVSVRCEEELVNGATWLSNKCSSFCKRKKDSRSGHVLAGSRGERQGQSERSLQASPGKNYGVERMPQWGIWCFPRSWADLLVRLSDSVTDLGLSVNMAALSPRLVPVVVVVVVFTLGLHCGLVEGSPEFRALIPNGANVPGVSAVGHKNKKGGGALSPFGEAFEKAGKAWTKELCEQDSDGDGLTNGQELGDPCCQWTTSSAHAVQLRTTDLTNPGDPESVSSVGTCGAGSEPSNSTSTGGNSSINKQQQPPAQPNKTSGASGSMLESAIVGFMGVMATWVMVVAAE